MDIDEIMKLKKQYESLPDFQLSQMLGDGKSAYVEGAYELLQAEAARRGLETPQPDAGQGGTEENDVQPAAEPELDVNTYLQLAIINDGADRSSVESLLNGSGIQYYFQNLHIRNRDLPVGLMVDHPRFEDAIELLKDLKFSNSIILW